MRYTRQNQITMLKGYRARFLSRAVDYESKGRTDKANESFALAMRAEKELIERYATI